MGSSPGPFIWTELHPPTPTDVNSARAALTAIASIAGQPRVVLEARGYSGAVTWRLGCRAHVASRVLAALDAHLAGLRHEPLSSTVDGLPRADQAAVLRFPGARRLPLRHDESESATRGLLAALSRARKQEAVYIQVVLGSRRRPSRVHDVQPHDRRAVGVKHGEHRFNCEVRVAATAADPARTRTLIDGVAAALRTLESPGVRMRLSRGSVRAFSRVSSPWIWSNMLSITDLVPFTGWPIGDLPLPGVPPAHPRPLAASATIPSAGRSLGIATIASKERIIALKVEDSLRHLHIIGPTGVGKSTLMGTLALDDMAQGRGVVVIDPKGDLVEDLLARIPQHRLDDVVVLDARDHSPIGLNGLVGNADPDLAADTLLNVFHSLYADSWGPRTHDILHASLITLARRGDASIAMIPLLLTNPGFRRSVVGRVAKADPMGLGSFWSWYEGISDAERQTAISPLMNKLRPVLLRPGIRGILGQRHPKFEVSDVFTKRRILLVSLSKGVIGPEASQLLGSLVVSLLWAAALGRSNVSVNRRAPVMVHVDEVQDYLRLPGDLGDALAQARGLGVGFTLAHQHLSQLPSSIRDAVLANARSRVTFQLNGRDAREIAKAARGELVADDFELLPAFHAYASLLVDGSPAPWTSLTTRPFTEAVRDPDIVRTQSRSSYGVPLSDIEAELMALADTSSSAGDQLGRSRRGGTTSSEGDHHD